MLDIPVTAAITLAVVVRVCGEGISEWLMLGIADTLTSISARSGTVSRTTLIE